MTRNPVVSLLVLALLTACTSFAPQAESGHHLGQKRLTVFAAASLTEAFSELVTIFETAHPEVKVVLNLAGSNTLRAQIEQGAKADVFASANTREMDALVAGNLIGRDEPRIFLTNRLVAITPAGNPGDLDTIADLSQPGIKIIVAAEEVPAGQYTRLMFEKVGAGFKTQILANVVSNETTVKQVVAKIQLGEADAGIVYFSDAVAAPELRVLDIPVQFNVLAEYPIAVLAGSSQPELAHQFLAMVFSPAGQDVLRKWGFEPHASH